MNLRNTAALPLLVTGLLAQGVAEIEPNDNHTTATVLVPGNQGDAAIGTAGDVDFWRITLTGATDLRAWINPGIGASLADSDLTLLAADGTTVVQFNEDSANPISWLSSIVAGDLAAGDYYLQVRSSQAMDPNGTGTYTIDVIAASPGTYVAGTPGSTTPIPVVEGAESNDPRQPGGVATSSFEFSIQSGSILTGTPGTGYADPSADYDFYAFSVTQPGSVTLETLTTAPYPAMRNSVLFLADSNLTAFAMDDDGGMGRFSRLTQFVFPGTYYAVIKGHDAGNYELDIRLQPMVPIAPPAVTVHPGGCGPTLGLRQTATGPTAITELPLLGSTYYLDGNSLPANAIVIRTIGVDPLTPPYDLGPIGAPGCLLEVDPIDQSFAFASATGVDYWPLTATPIDVRLIALTIEQQIAVIDLTANALGMTVSNRVSSVFGIN